jgi:imidazolonepropionase-like amidohydrolase
MGAETMPAESLGHRLAESFTRFGTTTVVDLGSPIDNTLAIRRRIEQSDVPGPRILTAGFPIYPPGGAPEPARAFNVPEPQTPSEGAAAVEAALETGSDLIKLMTAYFSHPGGSQEGGPARMPLETIRAIVAEAHERDALVVAHPEDLEGVRDAVAGGVDVLAHTTESGGPWPAELVERMVEEGIALVPTLYLYYVGTVFKGGTAEQADAYVERSGILEQLRSFNEAGGEVLFGTDVGFYPETDMTPEFQLMARAGMRWDRILASLTTAPAARFGRADQSGTIAPGMEADLVLLGSDPADDVAAFADVRYTIRAGEIVYEPSTGAARSQ